uniref:Flap endonuclease 1 n=1 Tax=Trepomonas sp. PC1 TaxID=1076344 RepID=A0A146KC95_9EUKA|eukprot:JAP93305.1 Flap endonuclease 1 [Trepomonas sp. PC1]
MRNAQKFSSQIQFDEDLFDSRLKADNDELAVLKQIVALIKEHNLKLPPTQNVTVQETYENLFSKLLKLFDKYGIQLLFVRDGGNPALKDETANKRRQRRENAEKRYVQFEAMKRKVANDALLSAQMEAVHQYNKVPIKFQKSSPADMGQIIKIFNDTKKKLNRIKLVQFQSPNEAEAQLASMSVVRKIDAVLSKDSDLQAMGVSLTLRFKNLLYFIIQQQLEQEFAGLQQWIQKQPTAVIPQLEGLLNQLKQLMSCKDLLFECWFNPIDNQITQDYTGQLGSGSTLQRRQLQYLSLAHGNDYIPKCKAMDNLIGQEKIQLMRLALGEDCEIDQSDRIWVQKLAQISQDELHSQALKVYQEAPHQLQHLNQRFLQKFLNKEETVQVLDVPLTEDEILRIHFQSKLLRAIKQPFEIPVMLEDEQQRQQQLIKGFLNGPPINSYNDSLQLRKQDEDNLSHFLKFGKSKNVQIDQKIQNLLSRDSIENEFRKAQKMQIVQQPVFEGDAEYCIRFYKQLQIYESSFVVDIQTLKIVGMDEYYKNPGANPANNQWGQQCARYQQQLPQFDHNVDVLGTPANDSYLQKQYFLSLFQ